MTLPAVRPALTGVVVDPGSLAELAAGVAAEQRARLTRDTYAGVYRAFSVFVGPGAGVAALTPEAVRGYRDALERAGRSPATIAKHLAALRALARALDVDGVERVGGARVPRGEPRALAAQEYARLLQMPDRRTRAGKRDLALLHLLGTAGLRRAEACALLLGDVDERQRASDGRLRRAIAHSTSWWVTVTYGKRGRRRHVPLEHDALEAIRAWVRVRPESAHEQLLLSLPRTGRPPAPLTVRDLTRIVARHGAAAGLPDDRRSPHVLRHTFCTHLAEGGAKVEVIRELAGHADIRTTSIYTDVSEERLELTIADSGRRRRGARRLAEL
ncbi:MAG TPA: tyrosine-type recombinase/integrase [Solirubrobacteraceae bacterium]